MTDNLDKYIKDSKVITPDSGEYRRLNRALIKEKLAHRSHLGARHRVLVTSMVTALLLMMSGQVSQLGSDSFDVTKTRELQFNGDSINVYHDDFGGGTINLPAGFTEIDIDEYMRAAAADEGAFRKVFGISYSGKTFWRKIITRNINGEEMNEGVATKIPPSQEPDNYEKFIPAYFPELIAKTRQEPPHGTMEMVVDGVLVVFSVWTYEFPEYGEVTYYLGFPVE